MSTLNGAWRVSKASLGRFPEKSFVKNRSRLTIIQYYRPKTPNTKRWTGLDKSLVARSGMYFFKTS